MIEKLIYSVLIGAAYISMAGCSSHTTDPDELQSAYEMKFTAAEMSRSSLVTNSTLTKFDVYANMVSSTTPSSTPTTVFNGTPVTLTDGNWTYDDIQYWIPQQTYSFAAVHFPNEDDISNLTYSDDKLIFRYTASTDYTKVPDILATAHRRIYRSPATPVALDFGHIMARINFVAKVDPAVQNSQFTINKIVVRGIASRATYTLQPAALTGGAQQTNDLAAPTWTISQTPTRISYTKEPTVTVTTGGSAELFPSADPLLVIPQQVTSDLEVEITYTRIGGSTSVVTGRLRTPASAHGYVWSAARTYTYTFTLGVDDFIIFDTPNVNAWDEDEGGNYIVVG